MLRKLFDEGINKCKKILPADTEDQFSHPAFIHHVSDLKSDHGNTQKHRPAWHSRSIMQETSWSEDHDGSWEKCSYSSRNCMPREASGGVAIPTPGGKPGMLHRGGSI